jgi:polyphenol oxidase
VYNHVYHSGNSLWLRPKWNSGHVRSLFSFRAGGVSAAPFRSLNMGLHVGDDEASVIRNREICAGELLTSIESFVVAEQVHGNQVACIDETERGLGSVDHSGAISGVDGLITDRPGVTLAVLSADCVPVLLYDPVRKVIATAHSGWKGTLAHIVLVVIEKMVEKYHSNPADIHVSLGPSIRRCCYEVGESVAQPMMEQFGNKVVTRRFHAKGSYWLGLQACIVQDLFRYGIEKQHIDDCGICTSCHVPLLFSYRKEHGKTGRIMGAIRLSE